MLTCHACGHDARHEPECTELVGGMADCFCDDDGDICTCPEPDVCPCAEFMPAPTQLEEVPEP